MSRVNVYIRDSDMDAWKTIPNKSEWLHQALSGVQSSGVTPVAAGQPEEVGSSPTPQLVEKAERFIPQPPNPDTGYDCCLKKAPCKHWSWNGDIQLWVNSITGKTREVV